MQVKIINDRFGFIVQPTNQKAQEAIRQHLQQFDVTGPFTYQVWFDKHQIDDMVVILGLTQDDLTDLSHGWDITKNNVDAWQFLHVYGYDAHESVNW